MGCVFCKIVSAEIPSYKVYENKNYLAFLSIQPLNLGHTLVIPKKHYRWVWDLPRDKSQSPNLGDYFIAVGKIAQAIKKAFNTEMVASAVIGEEIPHAHIWLVPRFTGDGHGSALLFDNVKKISVEKMQEAAKRIKNEL